MPLEKRSGPSRLVVVSLVTVAGISLLAVVAPKVFPFSDPTAPGQPVVPDLPTVADAALVALSISLMLSAILLRTVITGVDRENLQQRKPAWMQLIIFGLILFGVAAFSQAVRDRQGEEDALPQPAASRSAEVAAEGSGRETSRAFGWVLTGLMVGLTLAVVGGTMWLIGKTRGEGEGEDIDLLLREIDEGSRRISEDSDPKEAVIACYLGMTDALEAAGAPRRSSDTPFEYVERALLRFDVSISSAHRLTELFERARFSVHETDDAMRTEALAALDSVRVELAAWDSTEVYA